MNHEKTSSRLKRAFDMAATCASLPVAVPVMLGTAVVLAVANRNLPVFTQERVGKDGRRFTLLKLKTMKDTRDAAGHLLPEDKRTTCIGKMIRKTRLDELPQLFNILAGDMSLVGPRPIPADRHHAALSHDKKRYSVMPGLTGLAQVMGNNRLTLNKVLGWDHRYVDFQQTHGAAANLALDLALIAATVPSLVVNRKAPHCRCLPKTAL
jgi:lipopolysaccharide/colanic/teichoic acid biosynthesis glycosyltransferase